MRLYLYILAALMLSPYYALSAEDCQKDTGLEVKTPVGIIERYVCGQGKIYSTHFTLDGQMLFRSQDAISVETSNKNNSLILIEGPYDNDLACPSRMFLIDLTGTKPHVYAFGVKNACAEYHWASWGKKRSIIAIKENIRFTYSNGKLTPPPADFGDGTPVNIRPPADPRSWPFVEEIPIK